MTVQLLQEPLPLTFSGDDWETTPPQLWTPEALAAYNKVADRMGSGNDDARERILGYLRWLDELEGAL
jgi:hypothetical protein